MRPAFWEAHSNLGLIRHEQGNLVQAVAEYREAKRIAPGGTTSVTIWGILIAIRAISIQRLRKCVSYTPTFGVGRQGHACLASAYMAKKNYDSAVEELKLAVRLNPHESTEHRVLGQALLLANQPETLRELRLAVSL